MHYWKSVITGVVFILIILISSIAVYFWSRASCPLGTFACASEDKCVPQRSVCNNQNDCPNGDDEDPVLCADLNGSRAMVDSIIGSSLNESFDIYQNFNSCDVSIYPGWCDCKYGVRIFCKEGQLTEIPQNISDIITHLILANNSIHHIGRDSFENFDLTVIHLEGNQMQDLAPLSLSKQRNLEKLLLMNNNLTRIAKDTFSGLIKLEWLFLDNNQLEDIYLEDFRDLTSLVWLNLSYNKLTLDGKKFPPMPKMMELFIDHNEIRTVANYTFSELYELEYLGLRSNKISYIDKGAFFNLTNLKELDLYDNRITRLPSDVFHNLINLSKMFLGKNPFEYIPADLFQQLDELASLNMEDIEINNIDVDMFSHLTKLESVYFKKYHYCASAPKVPRCRPLSDGISSMHQLITKPVLRYATWIICATTCVGNALVIWGRFVFRDENKALSLVIKNLAVSDFLMGLYLLIIAVQDINFRDRYNIRAHDWISSWFCTVSGIIAMISSEVSVLLLVFMSIDRFLLIAIPFGRYSSLNIKETTIVLFLIWLTGVGIAIIPVLKLLSSTRFYGVNGLCFPLHIDDPFFIGWEMSASIFFGINATGLIIIGVVYCGMFVSIWKTRNASSLPIKDFEFAIRFFFIVLTDASCWLPIITFKATALAGNEISVDLYGWLIVFILPINSAINPLLYTFTTPKYRAQLYKVGIPHLVGESTLMKRPRRQSPHSAMDTGSFPLTSKSGPNVNVKVVLNNF